MALDIKSKDQSVKIFGIDANKDHLQKALDLNIIDAEATYNDLAQADLVVLAIPVDTAINQLPKVLDAVLDSALVIDVGSTKSPICKAVENHPKRRNFMATHPIAGTEFSGPKAAIFNLFRNKANIICEVEKTAFNLQEKILNLFDELGMNIRYMNPEAHDKHIAYVSHLSHISSFMLGKTVMEKEKNERDIFDMASSGFESTVRLAKSSPQMWTPIFRQNKTNILETLEEYINNLTEFKQRMETDNFEEIFKEMENTNHIKDILNNIAKQPTS